MVLIKKEPGIFWTTLVPGDVYGEHEIDGEEAAKMEEVHQSLAHLTSSNDTRGWSLLSMLFITMC